MERERVSVAKKDEIWTAQERDHNSLAASQALIHSNRS